MQRFARAALFTLLVGCKSPPSLGPDEPLVPSTPRVPIAEVAPPGTSGATTLPRAEEILERAVEAIGGRARLDAIHSYYIESTTTVPSHNLNATNRLWWKGGQFYAETDMKGFGVSRLWASEQIVWSDDPIHGLRQLEGIEASQMRWGNGVTLVADWSRYFTSAHTEAHREANGVTFFDVRLTHSSGDEVMLTFDETTGLLAEQRFQQVSPLGKTPVRITFENYQERDGLLSATRSIMDLSLLTAETTVVELVTNVDIEASRFVPPPPP